MRTAARALSSLLIAAGLLLIADAGATLAWQEPVSAVYARLTQDRLSGDLRALERFRPSPPEERALRGLRTRPRRLSFLARRLRARTREGSAIARIQSPRIGLDVVAVAGTGAADLRKGPGHYPSTVLPGARGTVAFAGHRTTYAAPFRHLDRLRGGDAVTVAMPYGRFTYRVQATRIVAPTEVSVTRRVGHDRLVLTACHPLYSAAKRIVVFARLRSVQARGAAA